jgi:hypothetical protein
MAVASRYASGDTGSVFGLGGATNKSNIQTTGPTSTTGSSQSTGTSSQNTNSVQNTSSTTQTNQSNMDKQSMAALQLLIQQLMGGGTQDMATQKAQKQQEINADQATRSGYSKEAAFSDAQGAMAAQLRAVLEKVAPTLVRAAQGAGTSQSSMRALLTQDMAARAAEAASTTGLQAATAYGGVNAQLSSVLANLVNSTDPVSAALVQALNIAKGAQTSGTSTTNGTTTGSSTTNGTTTNNTNTQQDTSGGTVSTVYPGDTNSGMSMIGSQSTFNPLGLSQAAQDYLAAGNANPIGANRAAGSDAYDMISRVTF